MSLIIDVISRKTSVKQTLINPGDVTVVIYEPSVVQVHAQASAVARYVREGNDLLIYAGRHGDPLQRLFPASGEYS